MLFCGLAKIHAGRIHAKYREIIHVSHNKLEWFEGALIIHILGIVHQGIFTYTSFAATHWHEGQICLIISWTVVRSVRFSYETILHALYWTLFVKHMVPIQRRWHYSFSNIFVLQYMAGWQTSSSAPCVNHTVFLHGYDTYQYIIVRQNPKP